MRSTAELVPTLFDSDIIRKKVIYAPLGVKLPTRWQRHEPRPAGEPIDLLFINSWCQVPENFFVRGGLDVLEAFAILRERYPQLRLTMRTALPALDDHYHRHHRAGLGARHQPFPDGRGDGRAARRAATSTCCRRRGFTSSRCCRRCRTAWRWWRRTAGGWRSTWNTSATGWSSKGRYGKASWADHEAGLLREDYEPMYTPDPVVVQGIVEAVSRLVEDAELRARLGRAARADVESKYTLAQWNEGLKAAFDLATGRS